MIGIVFEFIFELLADTVVGEIPGVVRERESVDGKRYDPLSINPRSHAQITVHRTPTPGMIQAIFFDFNGVIIIDEQIHLVAYREILSAEGVELTDADYYGSLGMDDIAFVRAAYARVNQPLTDEVAHDVIKREHARHRELIAKELPVPSGVVAFIKSASRHFDLGIVSMAVRSEINHVLDLAGIADEFAVVVSAEPGLKHKPAPDCYERALDLLNQERRAQRRLPLLAKECLVIEDAPPGIQAARTAGMRTIGVTSTVTAEQLRAAGAEIVTSNLSDWNADAVHHLFD